jgi:periplasmic divalent cation tolerance protein
MTKVSLIFETGATGMASLPEKTDDIVILYVTVPDIECGKNIARSAVGHKLAACGNIFPAMTAIYEWEGVVEEGDEAVLLLKTRQGTAERLMDFIIERHPYDTPCVMELPVGRINDGYAAWLLAQVQ